MPFERQLVCLLVVVRAYTIIAVSCRTNIRRMYQVYPVAIRTDNTGGTAAFLVLTGVLYILCACNFGMRRVFGLSPRRRFPRTYTLSGAIAHW